MNIEKIKNGEISCRNCRKFNSSHVCWYDVKDNGENCKKCDPQKQVPNGN